MATARNNNRSRPARVSDKPKITGLNLDTLKREGAPAEPYRTVLSGKVFTFNDPGDQDWQDQVKVDERNAVAILKSLMDPDDWAEFREIRLESWKLVALVKHIRDYYQLDEETEGNGSASPTY